MDSLEHQVADLILQLEREMRALGLWESSPPPPAALRSVQPFSVDTLSFPQWLQWVFVPKIAAMLERGEPLPRQCEIEPLADAMFQDLEADTRRLLNLITRIDRILSR